LFEHLVKVPERGHLFNKFNIVGSQFQPPLVEFSTACEGCPQVTYTKLLTQLFGHRMMIANATGCSIIWSSTWPSQAFTTNQKGEGPSWGNSLFEDNAEYGYGQAIAVQQKRNMLKSLVEEGMTAVGWEKSEKDMFQRWLDNYTDGEESYKLSHEINDWLDKNGKNYSHPIMEKIYNLKDMFTKPSIWIIGGDGFAYDIGFAGLDHVLAQDIDVNMFIFDNQSYANTGFQKSKATPYGTKAKFAAKGKRTEKKPLGLSALQYGHAYVAQVAMGADRNQFLKAIKEAEAHTGPSLIIAYSPCTGHGMKSGMSHAQKAMKEAVDCGFWNLWRYDPSKKGDYPFMLDSKTVSSSLKNFLMSEARFSTLCQTMPEEAEKLQNELQMYLNERFEQLKRMSENKFGI
jgi:pyruvate-ferredoxin/flavodoxin oxidoreductase